MNGSWRCRQLAQAPGGCPACASARCALYLGTAKAPVTSLASISSSHDPVLEVHKLPRVLSCQCVQCLSYLCRIKAGGHGGECGGLSSNGFDCLSQLPSYQRIDVVDVTFGPTHSFGQFTSHILGLRISCTTHADQL
mmetsp:Transcript_25910/g.45685  ORF Transcript_25910/g.45685 Transcript_25910/m.45685 type:complete len:137 (-) Transcript_25910:211-621(-)